MYVCMSTHTYIHTYICTYVCMYIHTYIRTYQCINKHQFITFKGFSTTFEASNECSYTYFCQRYSLLVIIHVLKLLSFIIVIRHTYNS